MAQTAYASSPAAYPYPGQVDERIVLSPMTQLPQPAGKQRQVSQRVYQARQRAAGYQQRLTFAGTLCMSVFLAFGLFQVSRALWENTSDIIKLQQETASMAQAHDAAQAQQVALTEAIGYYRSPQGTEALIRDYLNAVGPNEILVSLESL